MSTLKAGNDVGSYQRLERPPAEATRRWSWAHYLAVVGVPILVFESWTVIAWLADHPHQVTQFRTPGSMSWYAARAIELLEILLSILVLIHLVRDCKRRGKLLTFDVKYCIACASLIPLDIGVPNFFVPVWLTSSNFVNLNTMCGHMPFVVNPDCGRVPEPILFMLLFYAFMTLGIAILITALLERVRARYPGISTRGLFGITILVGLAIELCVEPLVMALDLWAYPSGPLTFIIGGLPLPVLEIFCASVYFILIPWLRIYRNDHGQTLFEQGLEHHPTRVRTAISFMSIYAACWLIMWAANMGLIFHGFHSYFPRLPAHVLNEACDAPGVHGTRYGPCPGSPGFRMPVRHSLPGRSP